MRVFYHATALKNLASIEQKGLLVSERGVNPYGLDTEVNYDEIYAPSEALHHKKPPCIHLAYQLSQAENMKQTIQDIFGEKAVILKVTLPNDHHLQSDSESEGFISISDIKPHAIKVLTKVSGKRKLLNEVEGSPRKKLKPIKESEKDLGLKPNPASTRVVPLVEPTPTLNKSQLSSLFVTLPLSPSPFSPSVLSNEDYQKQHDEFGITTQSTSVAPLVLTEEELNKQIDEACALPSPTGP